MHERGQGVPLDEHLAKRYYDLTLEEQKATNTGRKALAAAEQ
jgi:TPR repeat protein